MIYFPADATHIAIQCMTTAQYYKELQYLILDQFKYNVATHCYTSALCLRFSHQTLAAGEVCFLFGCFWLTQ